MDITNRRGGSGTAFPERSSGPKDIGLVCLNAFSWNLRFARPSRAAQWLAIMRLYLIVAKQGCPGQSPGRQMVRSSPGHMR